MWEYDRNKKRPKHISIRVDEEIKQKLWYICQQEGRSINSKLNLLIRTQVQKFEKEYGKIDVDQKK